MTGFVVIGRNEGERLRRCLAPLTLASARVVYVDSGSTDNSLAIADELGARIVCLESDQLFTAARARNAGYEALVKSFPDTAYVMFIDGDCEPVAAFPEAARGAFADNPNDGIIVGRVRERSPDRTIYNRLCDLEWAGPLGEIEACGGIFMIRRAAFDAVDGFDPTILAAEDDDLCIRVRAAGWKIRRIADEMCLHDAAMSRLGQWWRRAFRAGYAYAQVGQKHAGYFFAERLRAVFWGFLLPVVLVIAAPFTASWSLLGVGLYAASFVRTWLNLAKKDIGIADAGVGAAFTVLSKFPNFLGIVDYWWKKARGAAIGIVEYK